MPSGKVWADVGTIICGPPAWFTMNWGIVFKGCSHINFAHGRAGVALHEMIMGVYNSK
jgi:hypothetical protein